jgi:hypothetical protein
MKKRQASYKEYQRSLVDVLDVINVAYPDNYE